jgi:PST family polysaccharide transporter
MKRVLAANLHDHSGARNLPSELPEGGGAQPSEVLSVEAVAGLKTRARRGIVILALRTAVVQLVVLGGEVALARLLDPKDFGVFAIVQFALSFFIFFGDAGLGGGLIQKANHPTQRELSSVFFAQVLISLAVMIVVFVGAGAARFVWPGLPEAGPWLLRALSLDLLLTALRTVPCILMERELAFGKLAVLDLVVSVTFYIAATLAAWAGLGVWALVAGILTQGIVSLVFAYALHPVRLSFVLDRELLRPILKFGIPFQLNRAVGFANGAVTPIYAGSKLGPRPLGLISWAQNTGYFPLKAVEIIGRIAFPLYSRLQGDSRLLGESFGRSVQLCAMFTSYIVALFLGMGSRVIEIVFGPKWLPALPLLHVYSGAIAIGFIAPLFAAVLESTGRPRLLLRLALFWTFVNWIIVPLTTPRWGMLGFSLGYSVHVVVGNLLIIALTSRLVPHARLFRRLWCPALSGALVYLLGRYVFADRATDALRFIGSASLLLAAHAAALLGLDRRGTLDALKIVPELERS